MGLPPPTTSCPVCTETLRQPFGIAKNGQDEYLVDCLNCGQHRLTFMAAVNLNNTPNLDAVRPRLAHAMFKTAPDEVITAATLDAMIERAMLPGALERIDNLLLLLKARSKEPGEPVDLHPRHISAALGCASSRGADWVLDEAMRRGLVTVGQARQYTITGDGWQHLEELLKRGKNSRHAFMAMDFNEHDIRDFFNHHLVPGVARTGFVLRTTEHAEKTAGHIDARMRVELHTSRFVVCDLTHNNRGAYWEAGFAEGIGRPVFYVCRADILASQDPAMKPHFDIAHQAIVKWTKEDPGAAVDELVAMIRATLPGEAKMTD